MKFKKLEVNGFKSFADKLEIKFGNGVTAIVGPNGCGKSNVADSIRWVLGEQSAKLLRGASMQDVIFNGTENRKSLSFCEVSLYFDNTEKIFPTLEYQEVVISRKLYRSGESEYFLNKTICRLKDIVEILHDSGMGREGYSIIGQGRIDELLSAKPDDRRAIFEEAAGVSKFKAKKIDAERKLGRTKDNLIRINDILLEKAKQLEPLTKQSEAARKWLDFREKLKNLEINTYIYQFNTASDAKTVINNRLNGVIEEIDCRQKDCDKATFTYNEAMTNLNSIDKTIESLREELLVLTVGMEKQAGEIKLLAERVSYLNTQNKRLGDENLKMDSEYKNIIGIIDEGIIVKDRKKTELAEKRAFLEDVSSKYFNVVDTLTLGEGEVESNHKAVLEAMDKLTDIKSNMSRLLAEKEALANKKAELIITIESLNKKIADDITNATSQNESVEQFVINKNELSQQINQLYIKNNECLSLISQYASELDSLNAKYYMMKSRHKLLTEMQVEYEGFAYSVKKLLQDARNSKEISSKIQGVIAQLITVPSEFETAIEMSLGQAVQNIVTNNEQDAKFLIDYLKQYRYGRVTFLPITSIKSRYLEPEFQYILKEKGCYGVASDLIKFDEKFSNIMQGLLGKTVIVDNMDNAIFLAKKTQYSFKIVTLEGDIINPHGSITGGSKKSDIANIFGYDRELKELNIELETMINSINLITEKRADKAKEQSDISEQVKSIREKIHFLEVDIALNSEKSNKFLSETENNKIELVAINEQLEKASTRYAEIENDLNSVGALEQLVMTKKDNASENGQERQQQFDNLRKLRDSLHESLTNTRLSIASLENDINSYESDIARLQLNITNLTEKIEYNNEQIEENNKLISTIDREMNEFTGCSTETDTDKVRSIREKLSNLDDYKQELQSNLARVDNERMELMNNLQKLHELKNREEMLLLKVDTDIEQMQQRVKEEYELEYEDCLPFKEEGYDLNKGVAESNRLKKQMAGLGSVNIHAIEQCKEVYESYHEMDTQKEDLVKAETDLMKIIKELSGEMVEKFNEQFEKIRINFVKIFKELFDGGTADLIMQEAENPLEAGIEIVAQPPEKKLQSISLLSGGERALTAIAILFAILRLKPMPFCVLDEIEAALDDANAGRFAKYLRKFSEETQFIVITHRKPTMELADSLFGVTMEEKGISKIVSVKLSEAVVAAEAV